MFYQFSMMIKLTIWPCVRQTHVVSVNDVPSPLLAQLELTERLVEIVENFAMIQLMLW